MRDPKDVVVSFFHYHNKNIAVNNEKAQLISKWEYFFDHWMQGHIIHSGVFDHVVSWWKYQQNSRLLIITFEEMKRDHRKCVERIASFLKSDVSPSDMDAIANETTFDAMKTRPPERYAVYFSGESSKSFFREGKIGSWELIMSQQQQMQVNEMVVEKYKPVGIDFY